MYQNSNEAPCSSIRLLLTLFIQLIVTISTSSALAASTGNENAMLNIATAQAKATYRFEPFESISTYNGAIILQHQDFNLPGDGGLDIQLLL